MKKHMENLVAEVRKLTYSFAKLESAFAIQRILPLLCQKYWYRWKGDVGPKLNAHGENPWNL